MRNILSRYIDGKIEEPTQRDLDKLTREMYDYLYSGWIVGYWTGQNRVDEPLDMDLALPKFAPIEAIKFILKKLQVPKEILTAAQEKIANYSSKLAVLTGYDGIRKVKELFARALEQGLTKKELLDEVGKDAILSKSGFDLDDPWYTEVVMRTNLSTAYNAGQWQSYQDRSESIAFLEYVAIEDTRTTPLCENLNGTRRPINDDIWGTYYPPNHYMCRSEVVAISNARAEIRGLKKTNPDGPLKFEEGNESFAGNPGKEFGKLSEEQVRRLGEMRAKELAERQAKRFSK
jgi:SPP1 gp7 family putative phage head morphogenesis protein